MRAGALSFRRSRSRVVSRNGARWLTAQVTSMPSSVSWWVMYIAPALLTRTSSLGYLARTSAARRRTDACEARSARSTSTMPPPPAAWIRATAALARASLRATITSSAPSTASASAAASPMPFVAPVMRTRLPSTPVRFVISIPPLCSGLAWTSSEATGDDEVGQQQDLDQAGDRVLSREHRLDIGLTQRPQVGTPVQAPRSHLDERGGKVREQAHPAHAGSGPTALDRLPELVPEQQVGEVDARAGAERMVAPRAGVEVEQLVPAVPGVQLVLQLDQPVVADRFEQRGGQRLHLLDVDGLDVGAGPAELWRVLAKPAGRHAADRASILEERAVGVLLRSPARDELLYDQLVRRDHGRRLPKQLHELIAAVGSPRLVPGRVDEVLLDRRLDGERGIAV